MEYSYHKKSIWKWVLIYIVIGAIAYGLIYYSFFYKKGGYNYSSQDYRNNYQNQTQQSEISDWKTYKNDEYGFEINYPTDWAFREYPGTKTGAGFRPLVFSNDVQYEFINVGWFGRGEVDCSTPFADYVKVAYAREVGNGDQTLNSIVKVQNSYGVEGYVTVWNYTDFSGNKKLSLPITYFESNGRNCGQFEVFLGNNDYLDVYNKMLSAFKFTK